LKPDLFTWYDVWSGIKCISYSHRATMVWSLV